MNNIKFLVLVFLCLPQPVFAQVLDKVVVEGNKRIENDTVLLQIKSRAGQKMNRTQIREDIKNIYRSGFFQTVAADIDQSSGKRVLIFVVKEKPSIRNVYIEGNDEVGDEILEDILDVEGRKFFDESKIRSSMKAVEEHYREKGYGNTGIEFKIREVNDDQVDLTYVLNEGEKKYIREVRFEGAENFSSRILRSKINTAKHRWYSSWITGKGVVSEQAMAQDVRVLSNFYLENGFANVRIADPVVEDIEDGQAVVFKVFEGEVFEFGEISKSGDKLGSERDIEFDDLKVKKGDIFNVALLRKDTFEITEQFTDIGYAFTNVEPVTKVDRTNKTVAVDFVVDRGQKVKINRINVSGNKKTHDNVIRRSFSINEGETYSSSKIKRSQVLLQRLGYFEEVSITPSPTTVKDEVDLDVQLREGQTGTFSVGAGISSGDGVVFSSRVTENNLLGTGNSLGIDINTGTRRENYSLDFSNPRVADTRWSAGLSLMSVEREFEDFDRNQVGGSVSVGYPLWFLDREYLDDVQFSLRYEALRIKIDQVSEDAPLLIQEEEGKTTSSSITPGIVRNTIDNPLDPTSGSRQRLSFEFAGLGGKEKFWLGRVSNTFYYPFLETKIGDLVFSNRTNLAWGEPYSGDGRFPLFRRFFPGGINSVRGFDFRDLGPQNEEGSEFGGNKQLVSNFELILPVLPEAGVKFVAFYDIGNAFDDDVDIEFDGLRQAVGWGIRWRSPIAPIRIEIGYPIDREEGEDSMTTHFSFGGPL